MCTDQILAGERRGREKEREERGERRRETGGERREKERETWVLSADTPESIPLPRAWSVPGTAGVSLGPESGVGANLYP